MHDPIIAPPGHLTRRHRPRYLSAYFAYRITGFVVENGAVPAWIIKKLLTANPMPARRRFANSARLNKQRRNGMLN